MVHSVFSMLGASKMLAGLMRGASWPEVSDFLSPHTLQLIPPGDLRRQLVALSKGFLRPQVWHTMRERVRDRLESRFHGLEIGDILIGGPVGQPDSRYREARASLLLELYFFQIEHLPEAILDLRSSSFVCPSMDPHWNPSPLHASWSPEFIYPLREVYRGFYRDDRALFRRGLAKLDLGPAEHIFLKHFGDGDQRSVKFNLPHFRQTFHETFRVCKEEKRHLHPDFIGLGLMLFCLYEHLETLDVSCDVRAAYESAVGLH